LMASASHRWELMGPQSLDTGIQHNWQAWPGIGPFAA